MNWQVAGKPVEPALFEPFRPLEVLYDFDGPRIFTFLNKEDDIFLAFHCDDDDDASLRYLVVPFSESLIGRLKDGEMSVRDALLQPRLWVLDVAPGSELLRAWLVRFESLPEEVLPESGVMLWPSLEPLLSVRSIGVQIKEGNTPASVIRDSINSAEKAIKVLIEYVTKLGPSVALRRLYDLPAQRLAFNSFEIAFRRPATGDQAKLDEIGVADREEEDRIYQQVGELLQRGLNWVILAPVASAQIADNEEERRVILRAVESLTPPTVGPVKEVELRGSMIGGLTHAGKPVRLNRNARRAVKQALKAVAPKERFVEPIGLIREANKNLCSFELHDIEGHSGMMKFTYDAEFEDDVSEAFHENYRVKIWGVEEPVGNLFRVVGIQQPTPSDFPGD